MIVQIDSAAVLIALNSLGWFIVVFLSGFLWRKASLNSFDCHRFPFRTYGFEKQGKVYEEKLKIKRWKAMMPEAGGVFRGFGKRRVRYRNVSYLKAFAKETCRAEIVHYSIMAALPLFIIWNPPLSLLIMMPIVVAGNLPCIIIQRYNRPRLLKIIEVVV